MDGVFAGTIFLNCRANQNAILLQSIRAGGGLLIRRAANRRLDVPQSSYSMGLLPCTFRSLWGEAEFGFGPLSLTLSIGIAWQKMRQKADATQRR